MNEENTNTDTEKKPDANVGAATRADIDAVLSATIGEDHPQDRQPEQPEFDQRKAVNDGRLKKLSDELRQAQEENAKLRAKLEEKEASGTLDLDALRKIEGASALDDDTLRTVAGVAREIAGRQAAAYKAELSEVKRASDAVLSASQTRRREETWGAVVGAMEQRYPGLIRRIAPGGDLNAAYLRFLGATDEYAGRDHKSLLNGALTGGRTAGAQQVFEKFVSEAGLAGQYQVQTGAPRAAAAPATTADPDVGRKVWPSKQAILDAMDKVQVDERRGMISAADRRKKLEALEDDFRAGRYLK